MYKKVLSYINRMVKKKNIIIFNSYPAYSDNSLALFKYIVENRKDINNNYKIFWGQNKSDSIPNYLSKYEIKSIDKKSVKGIITFLRAKYVFSTHGYFPDIKSGNGQIQVNLWHGCGYKTMPAQDRHYVGDKLIVTSDLYKDIEQKNFEMSAESILPLGYPRNDLLFHEKKLNKILPDSNHFQKILIWLPTYR